ncbi:hypothetical protein [Urbifossiella limnaea]|uniref:Uncharacterized protein n=1 Tax=Urbifossiella limnaea TaxID=2528023 RepID=A0A517XTR3_9BACT|nr:hypothetical protein [Urbifossiella limnaea]QDU20910.1 hypothetical protein ETAA1_28730 [Urbifossiella limnaea]
MTLPTADWLAALAEMDAAVATALAELDAFEARWPDAPPLPTQSPLEALEARLTGWDERLVAAGRLAEGLERQFADGAAAVGRWNEAFTTWRGRIQQPAE